MIEQRELGKNTGTYINPIGLGCMGYVNNNSTTLKLKEEGEQCTVTIFFTYKQITLCCNKH